MLHFYYYHLLLLTHLFLLDPNKMCDFKPMTGKILKTVDTVHLDAKTIEDCKTICLNSPYRCFSFDFGDPTNSVCRTSHLDRSSLTHIEDPYLTVAESTTYELSSCYDSKLFHFHQVINLS